MRNRFETKTPHSIKGQRIRASRKIRDFQADLIEKNPVSDILIAEGGDSFVAYIEWLGLAKDPKLVVLSSLHHYYYDEEEMRNVKTVVNLKELNQVKEIKDFLHSISNIIPKKCYFVGCFVDNKKQNDYVLRNKYSDHHIKNDSAVVENGIKSKIPFINKVFSILDSRTNKHLSARNVTILLENYGFKVIDMTELDGLTYFCTLNIGNVESK